MIKITQNNTDMVEMERGKHFEHNRRLVFV